MKPTFKQITPLIYEFEWDALVSDELLQSQISFKATFQKLFNKNIFEIRMGFKTLTVLLSKSLNSSEVDAWLEEKNSNDQLIPLPNRIWEIPVCYASETGRDLEALAKAKNISQKQLVDLHSQSLYRIHFYGFLPGFMYLNGLNEKLHSARKPVPDRAVPAGSIAIGGAQTGIYPSSSPGGWHLIGQTPISLFDTRQVTPVFASVGDRITFIPISLIEFERLKRHPEKPKFR